LRHGPEGYYPENWRFFCVRSRLRLDGWLLRLNLVPVEPLAAMSVPASAATMKYWIL
jgi:hypothetical protein